MTLEVGSAPRPSWSPLPYDGCHEVDGKVLLNLDHLGVAMLRFGRHGTIHEHAATHDVDVVCLEGRGRTRVGSERAELEAEQSVRWPADVPHRLWTENDEMVTLMIEHVGARKPKTPEAQSVRSLSWSPVPFEGCRDVDGRILLKLDHLVVGMLRFHPGGTIDRHPAAHGVDVVCLEGEGMISIGPDEAPLQAGDQVRVPGGEIHQLWTTTSSMTTLMVQHRTVET